MLSDYPNPVNLGNPEEITILEVAEEIIQLVGRRDLKVIFEPLPLDDPKIRQPDISVARKVLNWEPKVSRKEGLKRTLDYLKNKSVLEHEKI